MKGLDAGDWPAWIALALSAANGGWSIWKEIQARRAATTDLIFVRSSPIRDLSAVELTVGFTDPEGHTSYTASAKVHSPRRVELAAIERGYQPALGTVTRALKPPPDTGKFDMANEIMGRDRTGYVTARIVLTKIETFPVTLDVTLAVYDRTKRQPLAKRRFTIPVK